MNSCSEPIGCGPPTVVHTPFSLASTVTVAMPASCTLATPIAYCDPSTMSCASMSTAKNLQPTVLLPLDASSHVVGMIGPSIIPRSGIG